MNCQPATGRSPNDGLQSPEDSGGHCDDDQHHEDPKNGVDQDVETDRNDGDENQAGDRSAHN
jgi:hypothetical protein